MSELRAATSARHAALDAKLSLLGAVSNKSYQTFLRGSLLALEPLEAALAPWVAAGPLRSSLIVADLQALGCTDAALDDAPPKAVSIENAAQAFGARYVIEGSALGGAVLARSFQQALGLGPESLHYLTLHGDRLREHWRGFTSELETWGKSATENMRSDACDTARAVFDLYESAFVAVGAFSQTP